MDIRRIACRRPRIRGLYHFAYPCRDAEETRAFYEDVLGLPLAHCMQVEAVPSTGERGPYAHTFFEMGDGSIRRDAEAAT